MTRSADRSRRGRVTDQERPRRRRARDSPEPEPEAVEEVVDDGELDDEFDEEPDDGGDDLDLEDDVEDDLEDDQLDDDELDDEDELEEELDDEPEEPAEPEPAPEPTPRKPPPVRLVARWAAEQVTEMSGRETESVTSVSRTDEGWVVELEVVESHRVPDSTDLLATYEAQLDGDGELIGFKRLRRYTRGRGDE